MDIRRFTSPAELDAALAQRLRDVVRGAGPAALMLSGGSTPGPSYRLVGQSALHPTEGLRILYSDERHVPPTSQASNYRLTQPLLAALELPESQVLRVLTELPLPECARDYDLRLGALLSSGVPIRLGLLGLGADGHTASLFSSADLEHSRHHRAIAVNRPDGRTAVSVTPEFLAHVEQVLFVVSGEEKRAALAALAAREERLIAVRAIAGCAHVEVWADAQAWPA